MNDLKKICYVTGRTGGHCYPVIAISEALDTIRKCDEIFVTTDSGLDKEILTGKKKNVFPLKPPSSSRNCICNCKILIVSFFKSFFFVKKTRPAIIVTTGGILSCFIVFWGWIFRIPCVLHEPNLLPGKANRFLEKFATVITLGYDPSKKYFIKGKAFVTGVPVRKELFSVSKEKGLDYFGFDRNKNTLLVMGGSQGAHAINTMLAESIPLLKRKHKNIQILHITGTKDFEWSSRQVSADNLTYVNVDYLDDMSLAFACCDFYVGRAGASIIAELIAAEIPGIFIPYPYAKENHQEINARFFSEQGIGQWFKEKEFSPQFLIDIINKTVFNGHVMTRMKNACARLHEECAAENIAQKIVDLLNDKSEKTC